MGLKRQLVSKASGISPASNAVTVGDVLQCQTRQLVEQLAGQMERGAFPINFGSLNETDENFLPEASLPVTSVNGEAAGPLFLFLFFSALGFFFPRLLLNWPFANVVLPLLAANTFEFKCRSL
jgi:hypothetical protein